MKSKKYFSIISSIIVVSFFLLFFGCNNDNPVEVDEGFTGITETGPEGPKAIGNIDPDDWLLQFNYSPNDTIPPIHSFYVNPVYPNPTQRFTTLSFGIPTSDSIVVWLEDKPEGKDVTLLSSYLIAGQYQLLIDLYYGNNSYDRKEGLVRLHLEVPTRKVIPKVHGDIEYKKP
ncbi:MAG: hypothetical protein PVH88_03740 [Ignavibacteria bacterium]|jgi:hypothetical protein